MRALRRARNAIATLIKSHRAMGAAFINQEYPSRQSVKDVSLVLDLGANVGYSSAYCLSCFPNSRVVAVEPNEFCAIVHRRIGLLSRDLHSPIYAGSSRSAICHN
jgi:hypothetical protein